MIFDTHAHYDDEAFDGDRKELLSGLRSHGIGTVVNIGASMASCRTTLALAAEYPFIYAAVGVHPNETGELSEGDMDWLKAAAKEKKCKTIAAGGGVIANGYLRELLQKECGAAGIRLVLPEKKYCTDNAAMIAAEGLVQYHAKNFADLSINACAHIPLGKKGKQ